MVVPTLKQRRQLGDLAPGRLALVQFLVTKEQGAFNHFRSASELAVREAKGIRSHCVKVDQVLAGGKLPYQTITVDQFPSNTALLKAFDAVSSERKSALSDVYALIVRPKVNTTRIAKGLGFLAPLLKVLLRTNAEKVIPEFAAHANPETGPVPDTLAMLKQHDQTSIQNTQI
jgi:hypothetical protein